MRKINLGQTMGILANVGVIAGIVFLAVELNQNTEQLALELQWQINQRMIENNRDLIGDDPTPVFAKSVLTPEELSYEEFQVASPMVFNFLNVWEDRYFLYRAGLIPDEEWKKFIDEDIGSTLGYEFAQAFWHEAKNNYEAGLVEYVDAILPNVETDANYQIWQGTMARIRRRK